MNNSYTPPRKAGLRKHASKALALILCVVLALTLLPTPAFAIVGGQNTQTWQVGVSITQELSTNSYIIGSGDLGTMSITSGSLPAGVSFNETLSSMRWSFGGTPAPETVGSYPVTLTDSEGGTMDVAITVMAGPQTIVQPDITKAIGDANFQLTPHSTNGNSATISGIDTPTYTYGGGNTAIATIDVSGNVTIVGAGTTTFTIDSAANASYQAAPTKTVNVTVNAASAINPTTANFEKYTSSAGYADVATDITLNGNTVSSVTLGGTLLTSGTDYTVNGSTYTFKKEYLATLGVGLQTFTFNMNKGTNPTLDVTVSDSTPAPTAPAITGPTTMMLTEGYAATQTGAYTISGTPAPAVSKTSGDVKITWNDTDKKLDIAAGLTTGDYPVILTATNGTAPDATMAFTLTVTVTDTPNHDPVNPPNPSTPIALDKDAVISFNGDYANLAVVRLNGVTLAQAPTSGTGANLSGWQGYAPVLGKVESGSVVITLYKEFLRTLPNGKYTLEVEFNDGGVISSGSADFKIEQSAPSSTPVSAPTSTAPTSPQTGDGNNMGLWITLLIISLAALLAGAWLFVKRRGAAKR